MPLVHSRRHDEEVGAQIFRLPTDNARNLRKPFFGHAPPLRNGGSADAAFSGDALYCAAPTQSFIKDRITHNGTLSKSKCILQAKLCGSVSMPCEN